jgi:hypothetical protein
MRSTRRIDLRVRRGSAFTGFRFPPEVIVLAVRWYLRFGLSYRDVEELLAERGISGRIVLLWHEFTVDGRTTRQRGQPM